MIDPFIQQARLALDYEALDTLRYGRLVNADASKVQRGGHDQVEFLNIVLENRLLEYLSGEGVDIGFERLTDPVFASLPWPMEETQFIKAPVSTARDIRCHYRALTPQAASSIAVWNAITLRNIEAGNIEASFLATRYNSKSGAQRIHEALNSEKRNAVKNNPIDRCVRGVFLSMGGLQRFRGSVSVIGDCNLSRLWWMGYFIERACADRELTLNEDVAREVLNPCWSEIAEFAIRRLTIVGSPSLMAGLIAHLHDSSVRYKRKDMLSFLRRVGQEFSTVNLHAWTATEVRDHLREMRKAAA